MDGKREVRREIGALLESLTLEMLEELRNVDLDRYMEHRKRFEATLGENFKEGFEKINLKYGLDK